MVSSTQNQLQLILDAKHHDAFAYLGLHKEGAEFVFRTFLPYAEKVHLKVKTRWVECERVNLAGLYEWRGKTAPTLPCLIQIEANGQAQETFDIYSFNPILTDNEL